MERIAYAFEIAFQIAIIIGGSIGLGFVLDNFFGTLPLFVLVMSLIGAAGAIWRIIQLANDER